MVNWKSLVARWRWEAALAACIAVSFGVLVLSESGNQRLSSGYDLGLRSMWANCMHRSWAPKRVNAGTC